MTLLMIALCVSIVAEAFTLKHAPLFSKRYDNKKGFQPPVKADFANEESDGSGEFGCFLFTGFVYLVTSFVMLFYPPPIFFAGAAIILLSVLSPVWKPLVPIGSRTWAIRLDSLVCIAILIYVMFTLQTSR